MAIGKVTISSAAAARVERQAGAANVPAAIAKLLRAVELADARPSGNMVLADDMCSCFFSVPTASGGSKLLRAYWRTDAATGRKIVVRVAPGERIR